MTKQAREGACEQGTSAVPPSAAANNAEMLDKSSTLLRQESRRHQLVHMSSFRLDISLVVFLEEDGQDLDRGMKAESLGTVPALHARYADAGLKDGSARVGH